VSGQLATFDPRLVSVSFNVSGQLNTFDQNFYIRATGCKYANPLQNECTVQIANLNRETRNYILTETSPFNKNKTPKVLTLSAGRVSTGLFVVYSGDIALSKISQPPDLILELKCGTAHFQKGKVGKRGGGKVNLLSGIGGNVASNLGLSLHNEATDKSISNYTHNGDALSEVNNLNECGCDAYVDDTKLVMKDRGVALKGSVINLSEDDGMIGVPVISEKGLKVTFLYVSSAKLGGGIQLTSKLNPAANGLFVIYKLNFAITSRSKEFYYIAECLRAKT
jgi:hypothetical protein